MSHKFEPYERVLVRDTDDDKWVASLFSNKQEIGLSYACINDVDWEQCIPYEGNEHLLGTTDSPTSEPEFKWGDHVEVMYNNEWHKAIYLWQNIHRNHVVLLNDKAPLATYNFSICRHSDW